MTAPQVALLLLAVVLAVGVAGLAQYYGGWAQKADAAERSRVEAGERARRRLRGAADDRLRRTRAGGRLEARLAGAGVDLAPTDFVLVAAALTATVGVVGDLILPTWLALVAALGSVRAVGAWLERKRAQRRDVFVAQLPDLARVLSNASSAGLSLRTGLDMAASELSDPAASELAYVAEELRLGQTVDRALEHLQERMPSREVAVLVATLVIQQRAGGDLVRALRDMADTLEARKDLRRELRTILSGAVFTGYVVAALGASSLLLINLISPGVVERMTEVALGRVALLSAAGLYALGFVLIRRTTRIAT